MSSWKCRALLVMMLPCLLLAGGCAGHRAFKEGESQFLRGDYDAAVTEYSRAVRENPGSHEFRMRLQKAREAAAAMHLERGRALARQGDIPLALAAFNQAITLDSSLEVARRELQQLENRLRAAELVREARQFQQARKFVQARSSLQEALLLAPDLSEAELLLEAVRQEGKILVDGVELDINSQKPITLKFKDADMRDVFNILSKLSGVNFIFDDDIRAQRVNVLLEDASFPQALEFLLNMNKLGKKVLNAKTIIIYPRTKEKEKQFEDQVIQTFYLSNIEAKKAVNLLRTMLTLRKVYVHEELNALVVRDTVEVIKLAQQLLEAADRADSEVVFDLELIEVNHGDALNLGPNFSAYSVGVGLSKPGSGKIVGHALGTETANLLTGLSGLETFYTLPSATFEFLKTRSNAEVLANPRIRVKNKEKANVHIGSREPVITVTRTGGVGGDFSENVQYVDVGVKLDIEPVIQLDDTIVTKIKLEVSSVSGRQETAGGSQVITITTTNATTALTLKDGERTIIGGLIRDDITKSRRTIPLLGDIPLFGKLFTSHSNNKSKREILLSVTPRIVKSVDIPRADVSTIWSGGEDDLRSGRAFGTFAGSDLELNSPRRSVQQSAQLAALISETIAPVALAVPAPQSAPAQAVAGVAPVPGPTVEEADPLLEHLQAVEEPARELLSLPPLEIPPLQARAYLSGPATAVVGDEIILTAAVVDIEGLFSAPLFVEYAPQALEFLRAEEGDFLRQGGQTTIFSSSVDAAAGRVIVGLRQGTGGPGASGGGQLFRLIFRAAATGPTTVAIERLNFRDPAGIRLPVSGGALDVEVR